ncbi:MAG: DNA polymerase IV [bacterium ADurb.Bin478]|nr:MAG: DNA polymerase IV [bacterium ADurb.Bin478]
MPNYKLIEIEGIGSAMSKKMEKARIKTVRGLLKKGATRKGRKELAETTGIKSSVILKWVNMSDLFRVKGIGKQYAELLEKAGVDTVKELKMRQPAALLAQMEKINNAGKKRMVQALPGLKRVKSWVRQAQKLPPVITY